MAERSMAKLMASRSAASFTEGLSENASAISSAGKDSAMRCPSCCTRRIWLPILRASTQLDQWLMRFTPCTWLDCQLQ